MWLKLNLDGMNFEVCIKGYKPNQDLNGNWTNVSYSFNFCDAINYKANDSEILLSCEVDSLISDLTDFLNAKINEKKEIGFIEPDWNLILEPSSNNFLELRVYLWNNGLTENYFSMIFNKNEIEMFYNYLLLITNKLSKEDEKIKKMILSGNIYE